MAKPTAQSPAGKPIMLGWYCPEAAAGRPGIELLLASDAEWSADPKALQVAIGTRRVKRFEVLAWAGGRAGSFPVAGAARAGDRDLAIGSYLGASPCAGESRVGHSAEEDPICVDLVQGCGLAVGQLEASGGFQARPYEEDPEREELSLGSACESDDELVVDMDGDGAPEHFSIADLMTGSPVELPYLAASTASCTPNFAARVGESSLTRVAVIDLNGDSRPELLYRRGEEFLLYGAPSNPARLELLGRRLLTSPPE